MKPELAWYALYLLGADLLIAGFLITAYAITGLEWFKSVWRGWNQLHAAIMGGDGRHSISAYCGSKNTLAHRIGRAIADTLFGQGHSLQAAIREGLPPWNSQP